MLSKTSDAGLGKNGPGRMPGEASGDAMLAKITPGRKAAFGRSKKGARLLTQAVALRAVSLCFAKASSASQAKDPLYTRSSAVRLRTRTR